MKHDNMFRTGWEVVELSNEQFWNLSNDANQLSIEQLKYLCQFALLAPTSHNTVPQRFKLIPENGTIEVVLDRVFVLPESDVKARQAMISLGAVLEHLAIVGRCYQLESHFTYEQLPKTLTHCDQNDESRYVTVASCSLKRASDSAESHALLTAMKERKNVRALYDKTVQLPEEVCTEILSLAQQYPTLTVHLITNRLIKQAVAKFQEQADRFVMENKTFARELGEWLLPNSESTIPFAMRGSEFGFDEDFSQTIHNGLTGKQRLFADQIASFAKGGKAGIESASAIMIITSEKDEPTAWLAAGRLYDEICLLLTSHSFVTAMHAALTEVDWASAVFKTTVLKTSQRPLVLLRIGKPVDAAVHERPHAARPALADVLL